MAPDLDVYAVGFWSAALDADCFVTGFCSVGCCSVVATGAGCFSLVRLNFTTIRITTSASATRTGVKEVFRLGAAGAINFGGGASWRIKSLIRVIEHLSAG